MGRHKRREKKKPVLAVFASLAGLQVVAAGGAFTDAVGESTAGLVVLLLAGVQFGLTFYVQNQTVPFEDVALYRKSNGAIAKGPYSRRGRPSEYRAGVRKPPNTTRGQM